MSAKQHLRRNNFGNANSAIPNVLRGGAVPPLVTAAELAEILRVTARTIHNLAAAETIPTAIRLGRIIRFDPRAVATALGLNLAELGIESNYGSDGQPKIAPTFAGRNRKKS